MGSEKIRSPRVLAEQRKRRASGAVHEWSCGFCSPSGGRCHAQGKCRGIWPGFVPRTKDNPRGEAVCQCYAAGHHAALAVIYPFPVVDVELPEEVA